MIFESSLFIITELYQSTCIKHALLSLSVMLFSNKIVSNKYNQKNNNAKPGQKPHYHRKHLPWPWICTTPTTGVVVVYYDNVPKRLSVSFVNTQ